MDLITAEGLSKAYGALTLFEGASFQVRAGDKIAIVGPNGAGKTTLLRVLAGQEAADDGQLRTADVRSHWFEQHPEVPGGASVRDLLATPKPVPPPLQARKDEMEARIADPKLYEQPGFEAVLEEYAALEQDIKQATQAGAVDSAILRQLGDLDLDQAAADLSGGERTRVFLARTLEAVRPGDLLVLDEPTNHLDVESIEWLEDWLRDFDGTVLLVAHDRLFLDNVVDRVFEVQQGKITCYDGDYESYVAARDEDVARAKRDRERAADRVADATATIMQFRKQKRFDGQYASRMRSLEKYQQALDRAPDPVMQKLGFGLAFGAVAKHSHEVLRVSGLAKSYAAPVLKNVELELRRGDRLGLVGGNGAGKSTLIRILTGAETKDAGDIHAAPGVTGAFFSQETDDLDPKRTLREEVLDARPSLEDRDVKALLGRFRFNPDLDSQRTVQTLSGGERQRIKLLKCVLKPSNLLILDEPTNHLDLWAKDVVIDALRAYAGTLVVVSHDRFLLDAVTATTSILEGGRLHHYAGTFTQTRDQHRGSQRRIVVKSPRYIVRKRFTDWTRKRKFAIDEEFEMADDQLKASMSMRNALLQGWIERL